MAVVGLEVQLSLKTLLRGYYNCNLTLIQLRFGSDLTMIRLRRYLSKLQFD